jgi:DNA-binding IclR family transcriptional regulator
LTTVSKGRFRTQGQRNPSPVQTLAKGLRVLALFDEKHREWTLDQLTEASGLTRATTHRMAQTLKDFRYLVLDPHTNRYRLGPAMLAGMFLSAGFSDLVRVARPYLESLAEETGESITLAVEVDGVAVGVDKVDTIRPFQRVLALGTIIGDLANSSGKIFCAFKSPEEIERILTSPHPQLTQFTITDPERLAKELERVRQEGIAFDIQEHDLGLCAVTGGVRDQSGTLIASVSVVVPAGRFGPEERERYAEAVRSTCKSLSAFLGYSDPSEKSERGREAVATASHSSAT